MSKEVMPDNKGQRDEGTYKRKLHRLLKDLRPGIVQLAVILGLTEKQIVDTDELMGGTAHWRNIVYFLNTYSDDLDESKTSEEKKSERA